MRRVVEERVGEAALIDKNDAQASTLRCNGAGEAGRAGPNDEDVVVGLFAHKLDCMDAWNEERVRTELAAKFVVMRVKLGHEEEGLPGG
jgi:hypothetical protein